MHLFYRVNETYAFKPFRAVQEQKYIQSPAISEESDEDHISQDPLPSRFQSGIKAHSVDYSDIHRPRPQLETQLGVQAINIRPVSSAGLCCVYSTPRDSCCGCACQRLSSRMSCGCSSCRRSTCGSDCGSGYDTGCGSGCDCGCG